MIYTWVIIDNFYEDYMGYCNQTLLLQINPSVLSQKPSYEKDIT